MELAFSILLVLSFILLLIESFFDLKSREVPDYVSYGFIAIAMLSKIIYSINISSIKPALYSIIFGVIFFIFGLVLFYLRIWGGADVKILAGFAVMFSGIGISWLKVLLAAILGAGIWSSFWVLVYFFMYPSHILQELSEKLKQEKHKQYLVLHTAIIFILLSLLFYIIKATYLQYIQLWFHTISLILLLFAVLSIAYFYIYHLIWAIEKTSLIKTLTPKQLSEGDWLVHDLKLNNTKISAKSPYGLTKEEISKIKKAKIKQVMIKEGIPFIPAFLFVFIFLMF